MGTQPMPEIQLVASLANPGNFLPNLVEVVHGSFKDLHCQRSFGVIEQDSRSLTVTRLDRFAVELVDVYSYKHAASGYTYGEAQDQSGTDRLKALKKIRSRIRLDACCIIPFIQYHYLIPDKWFESRKCTRTSVTFDGTVCEDEYGRFVFALTYDDRGVRYPMIIRRYFRTVDEKLQQRSLLDYGFGPWDVAAMLSDSAV